jgi:hypothetical protein
MTIQTVKEKLSRCLIVTDEELVNCKNEITLILNTEIMDSESYSLIKYDLHQLLSNVESILEARSAK